MKCLHSLLLLTGLVLRRVVVEGDIVPLPQVAVDGAALVSHGEVADLATVHVADGQLEKEMIGLGFAVPTKKLAKENTLGGSNLWLRF